MKAAVLNQDKTFSIEDKEVATPGPGQVRLDVAWCGVCGTDLHIFKGHMDKRVNFPEIIGHEASAAVAEVGEGVEAFNPGDKVVVRPLDHCGDACGACRRGFNHICTKLNFIGIDSAGAFQNGWVVPADTLHKLPEDADLKLAAFVEPLAVACHDVRMSGLEAGETAVILGGGPIGMLIAMVAKAAGANVILSEISEKRIALAQSLGFETVNPMKDDVEAEVIAKTGEGADVVFEVSGAAPPIELMTKLARARGRVVVVAIVPEPKPVDLFQVFWKELQIIGTRVYEPQDYDEAINYLTAGTVDPSSLITGEVALTNIQGAFESLTTEPDHMKVLIDCQAS